MDRARTFAMRKVTKRSLSLKTHTLRQLTTLELTKIAGGTEDPDKVSGGANCSYNPSQDGASCASSDRYA